MKRLILLAMAALIGFAAGCRGAGPSLVRFTRTGGIAMLEDTLDVRESGAITLTRRMGSAKASMATPQELERLRYLFESPEFAELPGEYQGSGFDFITYTIKAETSRGRKVVTTTDGVPQPQVLRDAIYELEKLMERCVEAGMQ